MMPRHRCVIELKSKSSFQLIIQVKQYPGAVHKAFKTEDDAKVGIYC
jgi:hypothetical protein